MAEKKADFGFVEGGVKSSPSKPLVETGTKNYATIPLKVGGKELPCGLSITGPFIRFNFPLDGLWKFFIKFKLPDISFLLDLFKNPCKIIKALANPFLNDTFGNNMVQVRDTTSAKKTKSAKKRATQKSGRTNPSTTQVIPPNPFLNLLYLADQQQQELHLIIFTQKKWNNIKNILETSTKNENNFIRIFQETCGNLFKQYFDQYMRSKRVGINIDPKQEQLLQNQAKKYALEKELIQYDLCGNRYGNRRLILRAAPINSSVYEIDALRIFLTNIISDMVKDAKSVKSAIKKIENSGSNDFEKTFLPTLDINGRGSTFTNVAPITKQEANELKQKCDKLIKHLMGLKAKIPTFLSLLDSIKSEDIATQPTSKLTALDKTLNNKRAENREQLSEFSSISNSEMDNPPPISGNPPSIPPNA